MSETGKESPIPDVPEDEGEVALALEHSQNQIKKASHPTAEDGQLLTQVTTGATGGDMKGSSVSGVHNGDTLILNVQCGYTIDDLISCVREIGVQLETSISSLRSAQTPSNQAPVTSKKQDWEIGDDDTDQRIMVVLDGSEITDDELYVHLHQCDVSEEDIQSLTDEKVYNHVVKILACCNIRTSEETYGSATLGIKMRVKAGQHIHKNEESLNGETEETISDVKLKNNLKGGNRSGNPGADLLDGFNSKKLMEDCTTAEGGQHHLISGKLGDGCSRADSVRKKVDAAYEETLMEDRSNADSGQNAVYSESLREGCTNGDIPNMKRDLLLPSSVDPVIGLPGNCVEFTFDLRCIQSRPVRVITRHNVEKTVEIGKLHPLENVQEVFTFLDSILTDLGPQSGIRLESGFYAAHPESVSEVIRIDLTDIQNIVVRIKTKLNVELILQISAMKPPTAWFQRIETFLSGMLLKGC